MIGEIAEAQTQLQEATTPFGWMAYLYLSVVIALLLWCLYEAMRGGYPRQP